MSNSPFFDEYEQQKIIKDTLNIKVKKIFTTLPNGNRVLKDIFILDKNNNKFEEIYDWI